MREVEKQDILLGGMKTNPNPRLFLERREDELQQLKFQFSSTNVMDEKTELVVQFLNRCARKFLYLENEIWMMAI